MPEALAVALGVPEALGVALALGVPEAVGVPVGVALGVPVGVGVPQSPSATLMSSILQPVELTLLSEAIRKRSLIDWPATLGPMFATVLM